MKIKTLTCTCLLVFLLFSGCTRLGVDIVGAPAISKFIDKASDTKSYRLAREGLPGDILMMTAITELSPDNPGLLKECAYLYFTYGLFVEDDDPEYAKEMFSIGKTYGMRALMQNRAFKNGIANGIEISELVKHLDSKYAPALCWTSLNAGLWVFLNLEDPAAFLEIADIVAMAKQSIELDEDYFHGVAKAFLGCYYAMVPKALNPECGFENSSRMFKAARSVDDGKMLLIDLFEARFLSTNFNDQKRFDFLLNRILESDSSILEGGFLFNELAKAKARYYQNNKTMFFN